jgi:hypothetical protein
MLVVVISEFVQLTRQVEHVPEKYVIEILAPNRADQPFDEPMRNGAYGIDLISSISSTRRLASQRWNRNNGSWSVLKCFGSGWPTVA